MTLDSEGSDGPVTMVDTFACGSELGAHGKKRLLFGQGLQDARRAREGRQGDRRLLSAFTNGV